MSAILILTVLTTALGVGLSIGVAGGDTKAPKIVAATLKDTDDDGKADRLVLTYNEKIKHSEDNDGNYPFSLSGPSYAITKIDGANSTKSLVIRLTEKASPDPQARPDVSYTKGKPQPVKDLARNEAKEQRFTTTMPLPCPENASTDFYANPVVDRAATPSPTGIASPPWCAFPTIKAALNALDNGGGVGRVVASGAGAKPAIFRKESFPMSVPEGVTLTTADDPDLGGSGLDPTRYIVRFRGSASTAVDLGGGTVRGMTFKSVRATDASEMVLCDAPGSVLTGIVLDGASSAGGLITRGLMLEDLCVLTDELSQDQNDAPLGLRVRNFEATGVEVANGAQLELFFSKVYDNGGDGFWIRGIVALSEGQVAFNGDDGLFVDESEPSSFIGLTVRNNGNNGFEVHSSALTTFAANMIYNNAQLMSVPFAGQQPQLLFSGPPTPGSGVFIASASDCFEAYPVGYGQVDECTPEAGRTSATLGGDACPSNLDNVITGYNISDASDQTVGIRAINSSFVNAQYNTWASSTSTQNVTQGAGSFIKAELTCGIHQNPGDTSNEPVN